MDIFLKASTETALKLALPWAVQDGEWVLNSRGEYVLHLIGPITAQSTVTDEDGETVITPPVVDNAFHANLRLIGEYGPEIPDNVKVTPQNPSHLFA